MRRGDVVELALAALRLAAGVPLVWAGVLKTADFEAWRAQLETMDLLPASLAGAVAAALCGLEIVFGAALIAAFWWRAAALGAAALYLLFAAVLVVILGRDPAVGCGCFGPADAPPDALSPILRLGASLALLGALLLPPPRLALDALTRRFHIAR